MTRTRWGRMAALAAVLAAGACAGDPGEDPEVGQAPLPSTRGERVRVEVLNGGGRGGMARLATERLRDRGFDVVYFGNGPALERTEVLDRVGRPSLARDVAAVLEVDGVRSEPDSTRFVDVTVGLGPEWGPEEAPVEDEIPDDVRDDPPGEPRMPRSGA